MADPVDVHAATAYWSGKVAELQAENERLRKAVAEARYYVARCNLIEGTDESRRWLLNNSGDRARTRGASDDSLLPKETPDAS